jgi:hypothetical protein
VQLFWRRSGILDLAVLPAFAPLVAPMALSSKLASVLRLWTLALALSALLVAAGQHWSAALVPRAWLIGVLLFSPSLGLALWIAAQWRLPPHGAPVGEGGESGD